MSNASNVEHEVIAAVNRVIAQREQAFSLHSEIVESVFGAGPAKPLFGQISESLNTDLVEVITKK